MPKENLEARRVLHNRIFEALKSGKLIDPLECWVAIQLVEAGFMLDRIKPVWVDFVLDSIEYGDAKCVEKTDSVDTIKYKNATESEQEEVLRRSESITEQTTFSFIEGTKVGVSQKSEVSVDIEELLKLGIELTYSVEFDLQTQQSFTAEKTKTFEIQSTVKIPKQSIVTAEILVNKVLFNGMFAAYYVPVWTSAGREQLIKQINYYKEYKGVSLEPLKQKSLVKAFPDLDLHVECSGTLDGVAGRDIIVNVSEKPIKI